MQKLGKRIWILIVKYFALCVRVLSVCCQTNNQHHLMMTLAWLVLVFQEHDCERAHFKIPVHEFISPRPCRHTLHSQNNHRSCSSALINLALVVFHSNRSTIQTLLVSYKARRRHWQPGSAACPGMLAVHWGDQWLAINSDCMSCVELTRSAPLAQWLFNLFIFKGVGVIWEVSH